MSDAVILGFIAMIQSWGNALISHLAVIVPAIGTAIIGYMTWRNNQRSIERAEEVKARIAEVESVAARTKFEAELMATGAERKGVEIGIKTERKRASDFSTLQREFQPESTDVFMRRPGP